MALITDKTVVLLLVLGFVQIFYSQARHNEFVFGPREHLDSGQESSAEFFSEAEEAYLPFPSNFRYKENSHFDKRESKPLHPIREILQDSEEQYEEGDIDELDEFHYDDFDIYDDDEEDAHFATSEEKSVFMSQIPLKRVRRRIIPVGKAIDRGRSDGGGAYGRSRNPWEQPARNRDPVIKRSGPTGSAALFSLYPDLAPPEWKGKKEVKSNSKKKKSSHQERDTESIKERSSKQKPDEVSQSDEGSTSPTDQPQKKKAQRRKSKLSKKMKEEIAQFAQLHGVERAVTHFKSRVNAPLREESVEKFLRRYKNRIQRKASRS